MQMIIINRQLYPWKDISNLALNEKKKEKGENEARASIPNPVKLFLAIALMLKTCFNVGNNLTPNNAYNILSDFLCSLMKIRTTNKTKKNHGSCSHAIHQINHGFVASNNNLQRSQVTFIYIYLYI